MTQMKERAVELIERIPDEKMFYVINILQNLEEMSSNRPADKKQAMEALLPFLLSYCKSYRISINYFLKTIPLLILICILKSHCSIDPFHLFCTLCLQLSECLLIHAMAVCNHMGQLGSTPECAEVQRKITGRF